MGSEIRFALKCRASKQRPRLRRNCSNCIDEKEAFVGETNNVVGDSFNRKTRSCLNINQENDGNTFVPSLEMLNSNSNLFHSQIIKQPHSLTPIRSGNVHTTGLYHRNVPAAAGQNENFPFNSKRDYYYRPSQQHCSNKNQCEQACEHYALDHHS